MDIHTHGGNGVDVNAADAEKVAVPEGVTSVNYLAFAGNQTITEVVIPEGSSMITLLISCLKSFHGKEKS